MTELHTWYGPCAWGAGCNSVDTVWALTASWANRALGLFAVRLVEASQVSAVDLLGKTEFRVRTSVSAGAVSAGKSAFGGVSSCVTIYNIVCIRAVLSTWADELNIVIDWGVVASGDVGLAASQGANLVYGTGYASRSVPLLSV